MNGNEALPTIKSALRNLKQSQEKLGHSCNQTNKSKCIKIFFFTCVQNVVSPLKSKLSLSSPERIKSQVLGMMFVNLTTHLKTQTQLTQMKLALASLS